MTELEYIQYPATSKLFPGWHTFTIHLSSADGLTQAASNIAKGQPYLLNKSYYKNVEGEWKGEKLVYSGDFVWRDTRHWGCRYRRWNLWTLRRRCWRNRQEDRTRLCSSRSNFPQPPLARLPQMLWSPFFHFILHNSRTPAPSSIFYFVMYSFFSIRKDCIPYKNYGLLL